MRALSDFLLARIVEDEATAHRWYAGDGVRVQDGGPLDPARILAECQAKRRIVEDCAAMFDRDRDGYGIDRGIDLAEDVLADLALPYADHPDYDEAWRR